MAIGNTLQEWSAWKNVLQSPLSIPHRENLTQVIAPLKPGSGPGFLITKVDNLFPATPHLPKISVLLDDLWNQKKSLIVNPDSAGAWHQDPLVIEVRSVLGVWCASLMTFIGQEFSEPITEVRKGFLSQPEGNVSLPYYVRNHELHVDDLWYSLWSMIAGEGPIVFHNRKNRQLQIGETLIFSQLQRTNYWRANNLSVRATRHRGPVTSEPRLAYESVYYHDERTGS